MNARNQKDEKKKTALLSACSKGHLDIVKLLLDAGAEAGLKAVDTETSAMHHAAKGGHIEVAKLLLDRGFNAEEEAVAKWKPLHYAALHNRIEMIDLLLERYASILFIRPSLPPFP
jgi:ankyrin repeat protein